MWQLIVLCLFALVTACAELSPAQRPRNPGAPPRNLSVELTSRIEYTPKSAGQLADPESQAIIAQCERMGMEHCRENGEPVDSRSIFLRRQHDQVITVVKMGGLDPDRDYDVRFRLFDPDGSLRARQSLPPIRTTSNWAPSYTINVRIPWSPRDCWRSPKPG
jgi:hypothetical protein